MLVRAFLSMVSHAMGKNWQFFLGLAFLVFVMVGFNFKTPAQQFEAIARADASLAKADSAFDLRIKVLEDDRKEMRMYMRAFAVSQCLDRPPRETVIMGLRCDELLAGQPLRFPETP